VEWSGRGRKRWSGAQSENRAGRAMGAHRILSMGGQIKGLETKVPSGVQGWSPGEGLGAKPPKADEIL